MTVNFMSADAFRAAWEAHPEMLVIDVRTAAEYAACHVEGAKLVPLQSFNVEDTLKLAGEASQIFLLCKSGGRAKKAAEKLVAASDKEVYVVVGGTDACDALGMPVVRGKDRMSLERQVRIAAGLLVVLGIAASWLIHPAFVGLSAFVGAGLVFAGVTDTCAMGMVLARMPWNRAV